MTPETPDLREPLIATLLRFVGVPNAGQGDPYYDSAAKHADGFLSLLRPPAAPLDAPSGQRNVYAVAGITGEGFHLGSIDPHHTQYVDAPRHITQAVVEALGAALQAPAPLGPALLEGLRPQVVAFAHLMESKLRENDHKGGWEHCDLDWLLKRLKEEAEEIAGPLPLVHDLSRSRVERKELARAIGREAADVANFAMMIADNVGALAALPSAPPKTTKGS
jgi:hypothetical protein